MHNIPEEAVKAAAQCYLDRTVSINETASSLARAMLTAALPVQVAVKKLKWELVSGDHYAEGAGTHYNIYETKPGLWNSVTVKPVNVRLATNVGLEVAKAAAQADYEARIRSALEPSVARGLADEAARVAGNFLMLKTGLHVDKIMELEAAIRDLSSPDHADAGKVEGDGIERAKFYHHQWPMERLLEARRGGLVDHSGGEAWRYEYSHKDEHGKYDILYRPVKNSTIPARLPSAPSEGAE